MVEILVVTKAANEVAEFQQNICRRPQQVTASHHHMSTAR